MGASLLHQQATDPTTERITGRMVASARRMSRMIEQILDLTRSRLAGGIEVHPTSMDLCPMLTTIIDELRAGHPGCVLELHCPSLVGHWDRDRLEQVFSNLIGNALQYGPKSMPVIVRVSAEAPRVVIEVHNEGPPIPEALQAQLFDPFRRGEREGRKSETAGLGLGLYITREIVLAHGGQVEVRSTAAEGTTFRVILPTELRVGAREG
jgi:sigma-B regulation protein RsbU (phosphoserine phosphatase)